MNLIRISFVSAILGAAFWAAKATVIGLAGGEGINPLEGPPFYVGFAFHVVSVLTLVLWWTRDRHLALRGLAVVGAVVASALFTTTFELLLGLVKPPNPGWVWSELNLWVVAAIMLALTWTAVRGAHQPKRQTTSVASLG
jgi:hypothetical protein